MYYHYNNNVTKDLVSSSEYNNKKFTRNSVFNGLISRDKGIYDNLPYEWIKGNITTTMIIITHNNNNNDNNNT